MPDRILVVEDDGELRALLVELLEDAGYEVADFPSADRALRELADDRRVDLVVTDLVLPGMPGQELLREARRLRPEVNVLVITAFGSIDSAIELVKSGAHDYLTKPFGSDELLLAVDRALDHSRLRREMAELRRGGAPPGFVGGSRGMQELYGLISRVAPSSTPVLITGESGTGKELVARAIHRASGRGPFVPINCSAIPDNLLESELFGHERGAFTGADRTKPGLFETAHKGTLFLDEVGELPMALQPKLLRVLEEGEVRRIGATEALKADVRILAATNRSLDDMVTDGGFREDLYWRLSVVGLHVPPLRDRVSDIPQLAEQFLVAALAGPTEQDRTETSHPERIAPDAMALLLAYPWPGNVRELRNAMARAATIAAGPEIVPEDLPARIRDAAAARVLVSESSRQNLPLRDVEMRYILEVLRSTGGNKSKAASILGLDRKTLYRKLDEYRLEGGGETVD